MSDYSYDYYGYGLGLGSVLVLFVVVHCIKANTVISGEFLPR